MPVSPVLSERMSSDGRSTPTCRRRPRSGSRTWTVYPRRSSSLRTCRPSLHVPDLRPCVRAGVLRCSRRRSLAVSESVLRVQISDLLLNLSDQFHFSLGHGLQCEASQFCGIGVDAGVVHFSLLRAGGACSPVVIYSLSDVSRGVQPEPQFSPALSRKIRSPAVRFGIH